MQSWKEAPSNQRRREILQSLEEARPEYGRKQLTQMATVVCYAYENESEEMTITQLMEETGLTRQSIHNAVSEVSKIGGFGVFVYSDDKQVVRYHADGANLSIPTSLTNHQIAVGASFMRHVHGERDYAVSERVAAYLEEHGAGEYKYVEVADALVLTSDQVRSARSYLNAMHLDPSDSRDWGTLWQLRRGDETFVYLPSGWAWPDPVPEEDAPTTEAWDDSFKRLGSVPGGEFIKLASGGFAILNSADITRRESQ